MILRDFENSFGMLFDLEEVLYKFTEKELISLYKYIEEYGVDQYYIGYEHGYEEGRDYE